MSGRGSASSGRGSSDDYFIHTVPELPIGSILQHRIDTHGITSYQIKRSNLNDLIRKTPVWKQPFEVPEIKRHEYALRIGYDPEAGEQRRSTDAELAQVSSAFKRQRIHDTPLMDASEIYSRIFAQVFARPTLTSLPSDVFVDRVATMLSDKDAVALSRTDRQSVQSFKEKPYTLSKRQILQAQPFHAYMPIRYSYAAKRYVPRVSGNAFRISDVKLNFNHPLQPDGAHQYAKSISFGSTFSQYIPPGSLPDGLEDIKFGYRFNGLLKPGSIPSSVTNITFGGEFNRREDLFIGILPESLRFLTFNDNVHREGFNQRIEPGALPSKLEVIKFGNSFNQPLQPGVFPDSTREMVFGEAFNQPLAVGTLPERLRWLSLDDAFGNFNHALERDVLPPHLEGLILSRDFNLPIRYGVLPANLHEIYFGSRFNQPLQADVLPSSLSFIKFSMDFNQPLLPGVFPVGIQTIIFGELFNQELPVGLFPATVAEVTFGFIFEQRIVPGVFPPTIQTIHFDYDMTRAYHLDPSMIDLGVLSDNRPQHTVLDLEEYETSDEEEDEDMDEDTELPPPQDVNPNFMRDDQFQFHGL